MRILGLTMLCSMLLASSAAAAKHVTTDGHVAHSRRAPVAMHRMSPPYRGNHVYEKSQSEAQQASGQRESGRRSR